MESKYGFFLVLKVYHFWTDGVPDNPEFVGIEQWSSPSDSLKKQQILFSVWAKPDQAAD